MKPTYKVAKANKDVRAGDPVYLKPDGKLQVGVDYGDGTMCVVGQIQSFGVPNRNGDVYVKPIKEIGPIDPKSFARGKKGIAGTLVNLKVHEEIGIGIGNVSAMRRLFLDDLGVPETLFDNLIRGFSMRGCPLDVRGLRGCN
jgi:hypothetical protein